MATCNMQDLVDAGNCFLAIPAPFREAIKTVLLCRILQAINPMASCDLQTLLDDGNCFLAIGEQERDAIQTQLLCEILQAGGGSGNSCITCGGSAPVGVPTCDCALHYVTSGPLVGSVYLWDANTLNWAQIVG